MELHVYMAGFNDEQLKQLNDAFDKHCARLEQLIGAQLEQQIRELLERPLGAINERQRAPPACSAMLPAPTSSDLVGFWPDSGAYDAAWRRQRQ